MYSDRLRPQNCNLSTRLHGITFQKTHSLISLLLFSLNLYSHLFTVWGPDPGYKMPEENSEKGESSTDFIVSKLRLFIVQWCLDFW